MKKITALITVITILFAMAAPAWAEDSYVAVSVNKPISALVHADGNPDEGNPGNANDESTTSRYMGKKSYSPNALTIDLEKKYVLDHVYLDVRYAETYSVYVSDDSSFTTYTELTLDREEGTANRYKYYKMPSGLEDTAYRYVRFNFTPNSSRDAMIADFKVYTTEENSHGTGPQILSPASFEEETSVVSLNKPIVSKQYGTGAGWEDNVVARAVDDDPESQFISCQYGDAVDWVTIDLEEAAVINKIVSVFTAQRTYAVYVTNTEYGLTEEFTDGIQLSETSEGSKVFVLPDEYKNIAFRFVRFYFNGDAPENQTGTEQNIYIKDIKVYTSSRDAIYNVSDKKAGALTDGNINEAVTVENNTVIDLLAPTYISSYEIFGSDKDNVTIKGSLFNTSAENMTEIPKRTTEDTKYRFITIVSDSGDAVSLNEIKIWSFFTDVVAPCEVSTNTCSVTVTNTDYKEDRTYTLSATAYDEYGEVMGTGTVTGTLTSGETKKLDVEVSGADIAKKLVCTITRDGSLVSAPMVFIDGERVHAPLGTPYTTAPDKDIEDAVSVSYYHDGISLAITSTEVNGIVDSDIFTLSVYDSLGNLFAVDTITGDGTFEYRLPGDADAGDYEAQLLVTDAFGNYAKVKYPFTKTAPDEAEVATAISAFANVTTDAEFQAAFAEHFVTNGTISFRDIPEAEVLLTEGIGDSFIRMLSARTLWKKNANETLTAEDIRDCVKAAVVENALENGRANAKTALAKYSTTLDNVFDGKQNNTYTAELFIKGAADNETLIYNMKMAAALSQIKNAEPEAVAAALERYHDILRVDLDAITASGATLLLVAENLDKTIPESYMDGLEDELPQILEEIYKRPDLDSQEPPAFEEELIAVSLNKPIISKTYGKGAGWEDNVVARAVDDDPDSQFISCQLPDKVDWVTIDLEEAVVISKIESDFTAKRTYAVYVTNTQYGQDEEFTDGVQLRETSEGSKVFELPTEHENTAYRYVRFYFNGDAPGSENATDQNIYIKDIKVYSSTKDLVYNAADKKAGALTDGDIESTVTVENNTVIDLLVPTYIRRYEIYGNDKDKVTIKGSLFNTGVQNMTEIPEKLTEDTKYRYIAIVSDSGNAVSLSEIKILTFFTDIVTPWEIDGKTSSVTVTNTSDKDERTYTFTVSAFDDYGVLTGLKTVTETLKNGETKKVDVEVDGAEIAQKVVCTVERDGHLVSAPGIFIDGRMQTAPFGTPYESAPSKNIQTAIARTDYFDGIELTVTDKTINGIADSDILTLSVYDTAGKLMAKDIPDADGKMKYRLPGDAQAGEYKAVLTVTDAFGTATYAEYKFKRTLPEETVIASAIDDFVNAKTDADVLAAYQEHYVENGTISFSDIPEAEELLTSGLGNSFIRMLSARTLWKKSTRSVSLKEEDIRDAMKAAVVENALESGSADAEKILTKYAQTLNNVFDGNQNNAYVPEIYKKGATTNEELIYNMKIAAALSQIKNESSDNIEKVLKNYSEILSVDLAAIENSRVDLLLVAKRLDNTVPESYKDGLAKEIEKILDDNKIPQSTGGGGGGGGGGNYGVKPDNSVNTDATQGQIATGRFKDVADSHWALESITKLADSDIISGRGDGIFDPESKVSRAEFATMLVKAFKLLSAPERKPEFEDCRVSDWFYPYVDAAVSNNIVNGISKTEFAPASSIRRQDACVMSYNIMVYKNYLKYFEGKTFSDSDKVAEYAKDAVNMLSGSSVINGFEDGSFRPQDQLSRAQAAVIIHNLMILLGEEV